MSDDKKDETETADAVEETTDDATATTPTNGEEDTKKRKVEDDLEAPDSAQDDESLEPLTKRQRQEETETISVDGNDNTNNDKDTNGDPKQSMDESNEDAAETDQTTTDNDAKDMDIESEEKKNDDPETVSKVKEEDKPKEDASKTNDQTNNDKPTSSNPYDSLKYIMVRNDSKPESLIKLIGLKSLFSRQLPKMPRAYISRLVFDRNHVSLVILNDDPAVKDTDEEIIGSICYRPFEEMRFAEIAFCAVNASHQVKGYGTKLMNLVKKEGARTGIEYFITYADNYAIGYFKKQGFTKTISMPKGRYQGLIKEYDGGTMMECYVHPSIDFTRIPEMLAAQRKFILERIKLKALSHKVTYDPLPKDWKPHLEGVSRANEAAARALAVPGMIAAGWKIADLIATTGQGKDLDRAKNALKSELVAIVRKVEDQQFAWPFREPVDTNEVKDYLEVIKEPIDLSTIDKRIRKGEHYKSKKMLYQDLMLMVNNCKLYNDETSTYVQCAVNLERFLKTLFAAK